jgi:hypothetical protein
LRGAAPFAWRQPPQLLYRWRGSSPEGFWRGFWPGMRWAKRAGLQRGTRVSAADTLTDRPFKSDSMCALLLWIDVPAVKILRRRVGLDVMLFVMPAPRLGAAQPPPFERLLHQAAGLHGCDTPAAQGGRGGTYIFALSCRAAGRRSSRTHLRRLLRRKLGMIMCSWREIKRSSSLPLDFRYIRVAIMS